MGRVVDYVAGIPVEGLYICSFFLIIVGGLKLMGRGSWVDWVDWVDLGGAYYKGRPTVIVAAVETVLGFTILVLTLIFR